MAVSSNLLTRESCDFSMGISSRFQVERILKFQCKKCGLEVVRRKNEVHYKRISCSADETGVKCIAEKCWKYSQLPLILILTNFLVPCTPNRNKICPIIRTVASSNKFFGPLSVRINGC